jgi:hypothetical protein
VINSHPRRAGPLSLVVRRAVMFAFLRRATCPPEVERLTSVLVDEPAGLPDEVFRRCQAADALAALGSAAGPALPALLRTLVVPVSVDCALALRVAAAAAVWRVSGQCEVALPFLAWALKDEYWGVAPRAVEILAEIGHAAVVPDLVRLAERRLSHGPFAFEEFTRVDGGQKSESLLAAVTEALGRCGRGRWNGASYASEARAMLTKLADSGDARVRDVALRALTGLEDVA